MSGVRDRGNRPTIPFDSASLARQDAELVEEAERTDPPPPARRPSGTDPPAPTRPRTVTTEDPLTTSLLAEVARRPHPHDEPPPPAPLGDDDVTPTVPPSFDRRSAS